MGKTPAKWIKSLLGKKSSKSNLKGRDILKSAKQEEPLISSNVPASESPVDPPFVTPPAAETGARNEVVPVQAAASELPNDGMNCSSTKEEGDVQTNTTWGSQNDPDRIRHEQAATKAQAAFRGYRARLAFRTLKGIIKLQALIRGHLVRRQAVATLHCVLGIVKVQALVRGQKVRGSDVGVDVQKICNPRNFLATTSGLRTSISAGNLSGNAFIQKLLASSPSAMPLRLSYEEGDQNSTRQWVERWTISQFWVPNSQPKKNAKFHTNMVSSQAVETEQGVAKRNVRKSSSGINHENSSNRSASESEKSKRNPRKISTQPVDSTHENTQSDIEKVKRNSRRTSNSPKEISNRSESDGKPKCGMKKASISSVTTPPVQGTGDSSEKTKKASTSSVANAPVQGTGDSSEKTTDLVDDPLVDELVDHPITQLQPIEGNGRADNIQGTKTDINSKDELISNESLKTSERRASFPAKIDLQENGSHSSPKVPSYMAPTESAKAKLRGQGSPRFAQESVENSRRHSLPSSANGKLSSASPRVPRIVQAAGKGVVRTDRSLTSSRDAGDKPIQAEWRR